MRSPRFSMGVHLDWAFLLALGKSQQVPDTWRLKLRRAMGPHLSYIVDRR